MTGLAYNIITEWGREVYASETGDTSFKNVPERVQKLWHDFRYAYQLSNEERNLEFNRILTDFQANGWSK